MKETRTTTASNNGIFASTSSTMATGQESSVEIATNTKGEPRVTVKVYEADARLAGALAIDIYLQTIASLSLMKNTIKRDNNFS